MDTHAERRIYGWAVIVWIGPGAVASWFLRDSVPWVTLMNWSVKGDAWPCCRGSSSTWHLPESGQG